jgi:hypothetical protein
MQAKTAIFAQRNMHKEVTARIEYIAPAIRLKDGAGKLALLEKYLRQYYPSHWELLEIDRQQRPNFKGAEAQLCKDLSAWLKKYDAAWEKCSTLAQAIAEGWEEEQGWLPLSRKAGWSEQTARQTYQAVKRGRGI